MGILNTSPLLKLVNGNALVFAKVVLSFHRRIDEASKFFAQGRVTFSTGKDAEVAVESSAAIPKGPAFDGL